MNMKYECWAYVNGKPDKITYVSAPSNAEAQVLAMALSSIPSLYHTTQRVGEIKPSFD
jgi:hypothetical protein